MKIKSIIVATTLVFSSTCGVAEETVDVKELCSSYSELARVIMRNRQFGVSMSKAMVAAGDYSNLVVEAYKSPRYNTTEYKQRAMEEFSTEAYVDCFTILTK